MVAVIIFVIVVIIEIKNLKITWSIRNVEKNLGFPHPQRRINLGNYLFPYIRVLLECIPDRSVNKFLSMSCYI